MIISRRTAVVGALVAAIFTLFAFLFTTELSSAGLAEPENEPPKDRTYLGFKRCAPCHFAYYRKWRTHKHANAFEILPAKYKSDADCLKCHSTGFGEPTGYKNASSRADLAGVSCEACHGPGSEHYNNAMKILEVDITPEFENKIRSLIQKRRTNVCLQCHISTHNIHPEFDK